MVLLFAAPFHSLPSIKLAHSRVGMRPQWGKCNATESKKTEKSNENECINGHRMPDVCVRVQKSTRDSAAKRIIFNFTFNIFKPKRTAAAKIKHKLNPYKYLARPHAVFTAIVHGVHIFIFSFSFFSFLFRSSFFVWAAAPLNILFSPIIFILSATRWCGANEKRKHVQSIVLAHNDCMWYK